MGNSTYSLVGSLLLVRFSFCVFPQLLATSDQQFPPDLVDEIAGPGLRLGIIFGRFLMH